MIKLYNRIGRDFVKYNDAKSYQQELQRMIKQQQNREITKKISSGDEGVME